MAAGTADTASAYFEQLSVLSVRGEAEFRAGLKNLAVDRTATNLNARSLVMTLPAEDLLSVEVRIPEEGIESLYSVSGEKIGSDEAAAVAEPVARVGGALAAWVGAAAGARAAAPVFALNGGSVLGAAAGGLLAGTGTYLFTRNYAARAISGIRPGAPSFGSEQSVIDAARLLVALELVGGDAANPKGWEKRAETYYRKELEKRFAAAFRDAGWSSVVLRLTGGSE
jgi:hypothetical protein